MAFRHKTPKISLTVAAENGLRAFWAKPRADWILRMREGWTLTQPDDYTPVVYFVTDGTATKIGISDRFDRRMRDMQRDNPRALQPLGWIVGEPRPAFVETALHVSLAAHRVRGEWFAVDAVARLISAIESAPALPTIEIAPVVHRGSLRSLGDRLPGRWRFGRQ